MKITREEILQDIAETKKEIEKFEAQKKINPRLSLGFDSMIKERKEFIKKLEKLLQNNK